MADYIGAIDQGTTSTRFLIFDRAGRIVACAQKEHEQIMPQAGWVEHNPEEIWLRTREVIGDAMAQAQLRPGDLAAIGITNQRETTLLWNKTTGKPVGNALVWQDTRVAEYIPEYSRDGGPDRFREKTGLPLATYFSALKIRWILEHAPNARKQAEAGELLFGTIDTFLVWHLTGRHITDCTNASRTQLMNLKTLAWDPELLAAGVPNNGGVYFVPAFSGLYAPYWKHNARGVIAGLTRFSNKHHIARAVLEAAAFQTREVVDAMEKDSGVPLTVLRTDGGMIENELLMQFQADILGRTVVRPAVRETTALGAAYAAGLATSFYSGIDDLRAQWSVERTWNPSMSEEERAKTYGFWKKAVTRTFDWLEE
jgi:glycerol kinase